MTSFNTSLKQGLSYPKKFVEGRLKKSTTTKEELKPGDGAIIDVNGKKVAVYRKDKEKFITLSPICTHLGCVVSWNKSDKTWDCPCHGSRFANNGKLIQGPAAKDLPEIK